MRLIGAAENSWRINVASRIGIGVKSPISRALVTLGTLALLSGCGVTGMAGQPSGHSQVGFAALGDFVARAIEPIPLQPPRFSAKIIAHRGFSSRYPENTVAAIRSAVEAGADMVEIDVQLTKDLELVVMHDDSVYRTTNGSGLVRDLTLEQIRALDAGGKFDAKFAGERVPTLEEAIDAVHGKAMLNIEVKNADTEGSRKYMAAKIAELVSRKNYASHVQIMAFDSDFLREMRQQSPHISMAMLAVTNSFNRKLRQAAKLEMDGLNLLHHAVSQGEVEAIHKAGLKTNVYTVNRASSMVKSLKKGVDGIITDYPDVAAVAMATYFNGGVMMPDSLVDGPDGELP